MFKRFAIILITTFALTSNSLAASDGDLILKKMNLQKLKIVLKILIEPLLHLIKL